VDGKPIRTLISNLPLTTTFSKTSYNSYAPKSEETQVLLLVKPGRLLCIWRVEGYTGREIATDHNLKDKKIAL
jgi:hypothetical protein